MRRFWLALLVAPFHSRPCSWSPAPVPSSSTLIKEAVQKSRALVLESIIWLVTPISLGKTIS